LVSLTPVGVHYLDPGPLASDDGSTAIASAITASICDVLCALSSLHPRDPSFATAFDTCRLRSGSFPCVIRCSMEEIDRAFASNVRPLRAVNSDTTETQTSAEEAV
jgi:hypothetical protein